MISNNLNRKEVEGSKEERTSFDPGSLKWYFNNNPLYNWQCSDFNFFNFYSIYDI